MARMIPELNESALNLVPSAAECSVYCSLRDGLKSDVLVLHSLELVVNSANDGPKDAEADFVIFDPNRGILVIEVKGGGVKFDANDRQWWSIDRYKNLHSIKDPFRQAKNAKHEILRNLKAEKGWGATGMPRITIGHAAVFPDLPDISALISPDRPIEIIGSRAVLNDTSDWVSKVFEFWSKGSYQAQPLGQRGMRIIESLYCHSIRVDVPLALTIDQEFRRQIELTERQARVLRSFRYRKRAAVSGGAGTGKTLLALQHAKLLASQGIKTLLVCYNRALADFLKRETQGLENLHALSFHQLCDWRIKVTGQYLLEEAKQAYPGSSLFDLQMPYALSRSTELDKFRYQAIVVDEGQDFGDEYWLPIELLLDDEEDAYLYIFFDPNQAVYRNASTFPIQDPPLLLIENCRNTKNIHELAYQYYIGDEVDPPDIEGAPHEILEASGLNNQAKLIKDKVSELITKEQVALHDVVVLVLANQKDHYYQALQVAGCPSGSNWSFESLWQPKTILVDTVKRFKGLESAIVLFWIGDQIDIEANKELIYVALSRARSRLFLVGDIVKTSQLARKHGCSR
ncbi:AAA family ATPase [Methylicorpusculum oleiharenae]|uniref:AAA family ATPase n=1 Tax=Methylicorpusculum oleiharenae TaxID=1338687 RepID=UPI001E287586|nr:NERD domain-containing protein/DEAD/DEAH box helicase [Methylicorpusculum oleiharenae]MCD2452784.1 AAA family ATPase [Methylicorpusculum oleiharenae]